MRYPAPQNQPRRYGERSRACAMMSGMSNPNREQIAQAQQTMIRTFISIALNFSYCVFHHRYEYAARVVQRPPIPIANVFHSVAVGVGNLEMLQCVRRQFPDYALTNGKILIWRATNDE